MKRRAGWAVLALCALFVLAGCPLIPRLGIQNDEVLFAAGLYKPVAYRYGARIFHQRVPLMLLSYLGATKTWFYAAVFAVFPPGAASLRFPMLLCGAGVIWMFYALLRRLMGLRAALIGAALLATDALFLLLTLWGPAIFHHLALVGAMLLFVRFHQTKSPRALAGAAFCVGLGLWDKALFLWLGAGLTAGALAAFPRALLGHLTLRNLRTAALWTAIGAFPLLLFNIKFRGETLRGNASFTFDEIASKAEILEMSLDSSLLFGWMVGERGNRAPAGPVERASVWLSDVTGGPERTLLLGALAAALLLLPFLWRTPARAPIVFAFVAMAVAWIQMAITRNAGAAAHHTVLLWPLPHLAIAAAFAEVSRRLGKAGPALAAAAVLAVAGSGALVANEYLAEAARHGPGADFTDAVYPLAERLLRIPAGQVFVTDWGMLDSLRFLGRGRLPLRLASDPLANPTLTAEEKARVLEWVAQPEHVFVGHTSDREFFKGVRAKLREMAAGAGFEPEMIEVVPDSLGRPVYEIFRFRKKP